MPEQRRETEMSTPSIDFPAALARMWVDNSLQMMKATSDLWTGLLLPKARERALSSTASPWWMPPQNGRASADFTSWPMPYSGWMPDWRQAMALTAVPGIGSFSPWLPSGPMASPSNPFAFWQRMWLDAAAPAAPAPWPADNASAVNGLWQPVAAAYRTANGHAMAAVLRTMADVVEPKAGGFTPAHYWPSTLGTRH
jgi:hypothetical protein